MSWLSDPSANKYIQSYFKTFIDLSGNLTVRNGNINLINGTINGSSITGDLSLNSLTALTVNSTTINNTGSLTTDTIISGNVLLTNLSSSTINNTGSLTTGSLISGNVLLTNLSSTTINNTGSLITGSATITTLNSTTINNTGLITSSSLSSTNIFCDTISINSKIIDTNDTGNTPKSFIYNSTTMCHKDAIVNNTPLVVALGNYVKPNLIGLIPSGNSGVTISTINSTNRNMTFSTGGFSLTVPPASVVNSLIAITGTNTFTSYDSLSGLIDFGIRGTGTSANQPFISSLTGLYNATMPTASLTTSITTKAGYINSNSRLVSLDTYPNQNFISMTGTSNPAYISATFGTNEYTILSRNAITPNTTSGSFLAVPITPTLLTYPTFGGVNTDFITQNNNITAGTKSTNDTATGTLTLSLTHSPPLTTITIVAGYVSSNTLKLEIPTALNQYVTGFGTGSNGIPSNINSFISAVPTAPSSTYTIRSGTGTLTATNTASTAGIIGYVRSAASKFWFISNSPQSNSYFIDGTGIPQASRLNTPTSPYTGQNNIMQLTQLNGYTITATTAPITALGMVSSTSLIKLTTSPALTSSYICENTSSFNSLIPNGTQISSYNSGTQEVTTSGLTAQTASFTNLIGYVISPTAFEIRGLGNTTPRLNWFITGSGIGATRNYVSFASSQSPYTLASVNTPVSPVGTLAGYTKYRDSNSFLLVVANSSPFKFNNFLISSSSLPENTGLTNGLDDPNNNNDIIVLADYSNYNLIANVTTREPTIATNPLGYKAYPVSSTTYYVLENITLGATSYIEATQNNGLPGFARELDVRGTPNANNLFTTSSTITTTTITTGFVGAIFNGGTAGYYFCSNNSTNLIQNFIVGTTIAPQTSVIYNSDLFDKGSLTISRLNFRTAPVASTPVVNSSLAISWYIRSNSVSVGGGIFDTELYLRSTTSRITTLAANQFFINSVTATSFNNLSLNGQFITSFTQEATLNCFKATFRGKTNLTASGQKGGDLGIFQISTFVYRIDTLGLYVPAVNDFIRIASRTNVNNIRAVTSLGSNLYDLTLEYTEGALGSGFSYVINAPITTTASLLQSTAITGYESQNLVVYTAGSLYSYYSSTNLYSVFAPLNLSFYNGTYTIYNPINYTIQTPFTYNYITPLSITDYGRTTFSFYPTETITFYTFFDVNLPPNQANTTLVSVDAIQTLTNKSITNPTIDTITLQTSTGQINTQLGFRISNKLSGNTTAALNTWNEPASNTGRITLPSIGIYLLTYSFTTRTTAATVLMGALTLLNNLNTVYTAPASNNVPSSVFAFSAQTNFNANYNSCSNSYVYVNTTANTTIYLWWASTTTNQTIQGEGSYFQAVRIA